MATSPNSKKISQLEDATSGPILWRRPLLILLVGAILVCVAGIRDVAWTLPMYEKPWANFTTIMSRSFFEGEAPGTSDLGVVIPIIAFVVWLRQRRSVSSGMNRRLTHLKFIFLSGLLAPLAVVQTFKLAVSRARPKAFLREFYPDPSTLDPNMWLPGFLGWDGPRGAPWNSFPSGHASVCAVLLVFAYTMGGTKLHKFVIFLLVFAFVGLMAIARAMAGMHWLSDSVASFFIVWAVIDIIWGRMSSHESPSANTPSKHS